MIAQNRAILERVDISAKAELMQTQLLRTVRIHVALVKSSDLARGRRLLGVDVFELDGHAYWGRKIDGAVLQIQLSRKEHVDR